MVTVEHVNCVRRLVEISVRVRNMWRRENEELIPLTGGNRRDGSGENLLARAVRGNFDQAGFGAPVPTQQPFVAPHQAAPQSASGAVLSQAAGAELREAFPSEDSGIVPEAAPSPEVWRSQVDDAQVLAHAEDADEVPQAQGVIPLSFADLHPQSEFDAQGLGEGGAMILTSPAGADAAFSDRALMRQFLLSGKSSTTISKLVDNFGVYARTKEDAKKRKKIRPSKGRGRCRGGGSLSQAPQTRDICSTRR